MSLFSRNLKAHEFPEGAEWLNVDRPLAPGDLRGRIVLLDFWTYCCINCMHVIPDLRRLEAKYPQLVVIGVHSAKFANEQERDNIRHAILRYGIEHPVVIDNDFALWRAYGIRAWPSFVLVDPVGNVAGRASGEGAFELFDGSIASLSAAFDAEGLLDREPFRMDLVRDREPEAALSYPGKLEFDEEGRRLFVSDSNHNRIVMFTPEGEVLEVIGSGAIGARDGPFQDCSFFRPQGMAYDAAADALFVADTENHLIRRVDLATRTVSTVLGTGRQGGRRPGGRGTDLALNSPWDLAIMGDHLYIAMAGPHQLWRMDLRTHEAERYAGSGAEDIVDGPRERAALAQPSGIDTDGERIYFADSEVSAARMVEDDTVRTLVGAGLFDFGDVDGPLRRARFQHPIGIAYHEGRVYVADTYNHKVKVIDLASKRVGTLVGTGERGDRDGPAREAQLAEPNDVRWHGGRLYIADTNNHRVRVLDPATDEVSTLQLANESVLFPPPSSQGTFRGMEVTLDAQGLALGEGSVHLRLLPPEGHGWNDEAPNHLEVLSDDPSVLEVPAFEPGDWGFDYTIPVDAVSRGSTTMRFRLVAYFCEDGARGFCRSSSLELVLPVKVGDAGSDMGSAIYQLEIE